MSDKEKIGVKIFEIEEDLRALNELRKKEDEKIQHIKNKIESLKDLILG